MATREGKRLMDAIRKTIGGLEQTEINALNALNSHVVQNAQRLTNIIYLGVGLNLLLLIAAFIVLRRELRHRSRLVEQLQAATDEITLSSHFNNSLQSCESHKEARSIIQHYMQQLFPDLPGALYIMRASHNLLELGASWNQTPANSNRYHELIEPQNC